MKFRKKTAILLIAIFMISTFAVAIPVMAVDPFASYETAIIAAADRLVATQNNDGGWEWTDPDTDKTSLTTSKNTVGVTAQGILDAYKLEPKPEYLTALTQVFVLMQANAQETNEYAFRIRGPDIPFLVELSEVTQNEEYAAFAKLRYAAVLDMKGGVAEIAPWLVGVRSGQNLPGLIFWDINLYLQGALALERYYPEDLYLEDAVVMADGIYNALYVNVATYLDGTTYDITDATKRDYGLAVSGALEAFVTTNTHQAEAALLEAALLAHQVSSGCFPDASGDNDVQTTAYSVMALDETVNLGACMDAGNYFVNTQLESGAWGTGLDECSEVTSEVAQALYDIRCLTKADLVPGKGKGIDDAPGLDKAPPNDNFGGRYRHGHGKEE